MTRVEHIQLGDGRRILFDAEDAEFIVSKQWHATPRYARSWNFGKPIWLHRKLLEAPSGWQVDHLNRDGLDNRRQNLRLCRPAENTWNRGSRGGGSSFKGVFLDRGRWYCSIMAQGSRTKVRCASELEAARKYDQLAVALHGRFALLNNPDGVA